CKIPRPTELSQIFITANRGEGEDPGGENGRQSIDELQEGEDHPKHSYMTHDKLTSNYRRRYENQVS
uniref:Uncharacterized protein n=1 Tax=Glossina palpalis gambiensis TaxID=67801 RepID=A0A1B0ALK7_9MUSC